MALQLNMTSSSGAIGTYARISSININRDDCVDEFVNIIVQVYVNQAARQALMAPLMQLNYITTLSAFTDANPVGDCYIYLMTLSDFAGATEI